MSKSENEATFPIDLYGWMGLRSLGKVVIRAVSIEKRKQRVTDTDGHAVDEAFAEGGVKIRPKLRNIHEIVRRV